MREKLGFEANPAAQDPAPSADIEKNTRERRSRTTNKDREDR
jgi:hypothetical protein